MNTDLIASSSILIKSSPEKIWNTLTNPVKIKSYLFGTNVSSDWKKGSPILFEGEYNGQTYKDKGQVLEHRENELLQYSYWSGFSGLEDLPENYSTVTYSIEKVGDAYQFTWHQQGFASEEGKCHTEEGLKSILEQIKALTEA